MSHSPKNVVLTTFPHMSSGRMYILFITCPTNVFFLSDSPLINCSIKVRAHVSSLVPQWNMRNGIAIEYCLSQRVLLVKGTKIPAMSINTWIIEITWDDITLYSIYPGICLAAHPAQQDIDRQHTKETDPILATPTFNANGFIIAICFFVEEAIKIKHIIQQMPDTD